MISALQRDQDGTLKLTVTIPWEKVEKAQETVIDSLSKNANLPGFRKGKAPKKLVSENVDREHVKEDILKKLLPDMYVDALKEHNLRPIISPRIHVEKLEDGKDWQFVAITCELPEINLGEYKKSVGNVTAKSKIVIPGKEPTQPNFDDIVKALLESVKITVPKILVEQEVERLLSQLLDDVKKLGLTLDQYLGSTGKQAEDIRIDYEKKAITDMTIEFALQKIADTENIAVEESEVNEAIQKAKDETEKKQLESNRYLLSNILRQQKTLDFLKSL